MLPDPNSISIDHAADTILFPGDELDRIFHQEHDHHAAPLFRPMWEYSNRKDYSYIFMTQEFLSLLHTLKEEHLISGIQAEFGCSPWPATNIWFEGPDIETLPEVAKHGLTDKHWTHKYRSEFESIRLGQDTTHVLKRRITRLLVDYHFMVHRLHDELSDRPVTAEMDLRAFNNEKDVLYPDYSSVRDPSRIGFLMGADPETMMHLRQLNDLSLESARRRAIKTQGLSYRHGEPFINGVILSALFNYIPWKAFLKKLDEFILPGGLLVVYNAQEGERAHLDWKNITEDQELITAFIQDDLKYTLRIHELRKDAGPTTPLYLVAQKVN